MKTFKKITYSALIIWFLLIVGCGNSEKSKDATENTSANPIENPVTAPVESDSDNQQGSDHSYDIIINPGSANERHLTGKIKNSSQDDGRMNNFSVYSNTPNGKGIVLRIGNGDITINGLFFHKNNGTTSDLFDGSEDDSEEKSHMILTIAPPSTDIHNSLSGTLNLSNIEYAHENDAGGAVAYTLDFDGKFEAANETESRIKGHVVVRIPAYL